ncbi:MAG: EamA family transporter [Patescibacteria group bacterium]
MTTHIPLWILFGLLSAVFASLVAIFGKMGLQKVDPTLATAIRSVIMASFMIVTAASLGKFTGVSVDTLNGKEWLLIALAGVAGALSWLFYFSALRMGPASAVAALDRLSVAFVIIFSLLFLGEAFKWKTILGGLLIVLGALLIVFV